MGVFYIAMAVIPALAVILRFWSKALLPASPREKLSRRYGRDDWTILLAAVSVEQVVSKESS
jgi:hypothetical protein